MSNSSEKSTFGTRLSRALKETDMSQAQLARSVGVSAKTIERYAKRDEPPSLQRKDVQETISTVSSQLNVREEWLVEGVGEMRTTFNPDGSDEARLSGEPFDLLKRARLSADLSRSEAAAFLREHGMEITSQDLGDLESGDADSVSLGQYGTVIYLLAKRSGGSPQNDRGSVGEYFSSEVQIIPEFRLSSTEENQHILQEGSLLLSKSYIQQQHGVDPARVVVMRVRGNGMADTLRPGQVVLAMRWDQEQELEDGAIYGLKGPHGFSIRRLRFDWLEGEPAIWIWTDNDEYADQRRRLSLGEFNQEYQAVALALEAGQKL